MGEGFGPLIQMYPHSVQADLISMKPEPIHYVCSDGAQADTPPLHCKNSTCFHKFFTCLSNENIAKILTSGSTLRYTVVFTPRAERTPRILQMIFCKELDSKKLFNFSRYYVSQTNVLENKFALTQWLKHLSLIHQWKLKKCEHVFV